MSFPWANPAIKKEKISRNIAVLNLELGKVGTYIEELTEVKNTKTSINSPERTKYQRQIDRHIKMAGCIERQIVREKLKLSRLPD